jgi:signal transduction histidine kinase
MQSLSARLLVLTVLFVMLAEVFIFVPSVARFRTSYLEEKLRAGHLAILTLDAAPDQMVSKELGETLLRHVGAHAISIRRDGAKLVIMADSPPIVDQVVSLDDSMPQSQIMAAFDTFFSTGNRILLVSGYSPQEPEAAMQVILDERPLRTALISFAGRIFLLSIAISLFTALLVYLVLRWLFVRPMRRITKNMVNFSVDPEDINRVIAPSGRRDEVGVAERELADMQQALRQALQQKDRLAALGTAVAKINHDLKGILSSALLMSDRLERSEDPDVRRVTPTLISSIERAVDLCKETLDFAGPDQQPIKRTYVDLGDIVTDAIAGMGEDVDVSTSFASPQTVRVDRDQIFRILNNLLVNAIQAGADRISLTGETGSSHYLLDIDDNGPGMAPKAQENLFKPFKGSARAGGTGLGLAISRELARQHGGDLHLVKTDGQGTTFRLVLPIL